MRLADRLAAGLPLIRDVAPKYEPICRPILFSAPMVRALLAGTKTQTRRTMKPATTASPMRDINCPYGKPGDRLWVRETWRVGVAHDQIKPRDLPSNLLVKYTADPSTGDDLGWGKVRPSIFTLRWASRITLEITDVRVQRLQEISEEDAAAEGLRRAPDGNWFAPLADNKDRTLTVGVGIPSAVKAYSALWNSINGAGSWELNPWVWALTFKRVKS